MSESKAVVKREMPQIVPILPANYEEVYKMGNMLAGTDMVPKDFKGKPHNCIVAIQMGLEIGLLPIQAVQNIAVINGRPSLWGDALLALIRASGHLEWIKEEKFDTYATCEAKRHGERFPVLTKFTVEDAKTAGLWKKVGPWTTAPKRMLLMRARGFTLRDLFPDVLKGIQSSEEQRDIIDIDIQGNVIDTEALEAGRKEFDAKKEVIADGLGDQTEPPETQEEEPPQDPPAPAETSGKTIADEGAEPPAMEDDLPLDPDPPPPVEEDPQAQVSSEKFTAFMIKAKERKIKVTRLVKLAKDNKLSDISSMRNEQYDGMMQALDLIT